jgi:hypothetical protein
MTIRASAPNARLPMMRSVGSLPAVPFVKCVIPTTAQAVASALYAVRHAPMRTRRGFLVSAMPSSDVQMSTYSFRRPCAVRPIISGGDGCGMRQSNCGFSSFRRPGEEVKLSFCDPTFPKPINGLHFDGLRSFAATIIARGGQDLRLLAWLASNLNPEASPMIEHGKSLVEREDNRMRDAVPNAPYLKVFLCSG